VTQPPAPEPERPFGAPTELDADEARKAQLTNRFDIRRIIGGLFVLYAAILIVLGIFGTHAIKTKADGINVNLWVGLAMLAFGVLMIAWALWRPVAPEPPEHEGRGSGRLRRAPS
jgi:NADH:ubiquinone oxidoreductase subunit 6 (subunit J)